MRGQNRGMTLPEILVGSFVSLLILTMVAMVVMQLKMQTHSTEAVLQARYEVQFLFINLERELSKTTAEGFHLASDQPAFSVQTMDGMSLNGTRAWSPFVSIYTYDATKRQVLKGKIELSELGLTHNPKLPAELTDEDIALMLQLRTNDGKLQPMAGDIDRFNLVALSPETLQINIGSVMKSGKFKDEEVEDQRVLLFSSAADDV